MELIDGVFHQLSMDNALVAITADYPGLFPALKAPPAMHHQYRMVRIEHGSNDGVKTSVVVTWEAGNKPG